MNKVKFGLSNVHIAPLTYDGTKYTYSEIIKIPGAVSLSLEPSGDSNDFYADNVIYFSSTANQGYEGDLEIAMITDEMKGFPAEMIDAPKNNALAKKTNIKFNGRYMFTTQAPIVSGDEVLVTAKNIATMFNMAYQRNEKGYTLKNALTEITFASDGSSAKKNNASLNLSADCVIKGIQLFVPISDVAEALGLECSFNKETNEVVINGKIQTEVE